MEAIASVPPITIGGNWVDQVKDSIPDTAKDIRLNLDSVINRSPFDPVDTHAIALMGQNNVWYPFVEMCDDPELKGLPAGLRMNAYANNGGTTKKQFEMYTLAASIIGKCHFCVKAHYEALKKEGLTVQQLQHIGKIAATINAIGKVAI
jgi:alkyl hydroperoxide reductase subunit D